jgi:hypothetical protein
MTGVKIKVKVVANALAYYGTAKNTTIKSVTVQAPGRYYENSQITDKKSFYNDRRACIIHQCRKTTVISCHRCLINTGIEKMTYI